MLPRIFLPLSLSRCTHLCTRRAIAHSRRRSEALHSAAQRRQRLTIYFYLLKQGALS